MKKLLQMRVKRRFTYKILFILILVFFFFYFYMQRSSSQNNPSYNDPSGLVIINANNLQNPVRENRSTESNRVRINGIEVIRDVNYDYEALIRKEEDNIVPGLGEYGVPVTVVDGVSDEDIERCMKTEGFNKILSDKISYIRKIPDARDPTCAQVVFDEDLPTASVIIIFNNEAWSTLIRTVHSTLIRSPQKFLKEIILVDDASDKDELMGKLEYYIRTRLPDHVKLIRLPKRSGLIRARLAGARIATGDLIVFLDAHCEVGIDWLQPILTRIKYKEDAIVMPIIDVIDSRHMGYMYNHNSNDFQIGGFTWAGHFTWIQIPQQEKERHGSPISPTRSPTMAGGLLAVNREYFWRIGSYDAQMEIWGGENLEMSFRVWQCGGTLEIHPCSRAGHVFRSFHPYSFDGKVDTHGYNTARMAEVWMDDYKRLFYLHRPDLKDSKKGDLSDRKTLRKKLNCHDFNWYLKHIYPQKFILDDDAVAYGQVRARDRPLCFDTLLGGEDKTYNLGIYYCHQKLSASQFFSLSKNAELRRELICAEVQDHNVSMTKCNDGSNQKWIITEENFLKHLETGLCITHFGLKSDAKLTVVKCNQKNTHYLQWDWEFTRYNSGEVVRNFGSLP